MSDLVERLRNPVAYGPVGAQKERIEAADEISRLSCENSQLKEQLEGALDLLDGTTIHCDDTAKVKERIADPKLVDVDLEDL